MVGDRRAQETRTRLLEAATEIFSEQGFRSTRVRDICEKAGANIAAVNYHFGDKQKLYEAVLDYAFSRLPDIELPQKVGRGRQAVEQQLRAFVRSFLAQLLGSGRNALYADLLAREISDPTPALNRVIENGMRPQVEALKSLVRKLLGAKTTAKRVRRCTGSILGQCLYFHVGRPVILGTGLEKKLDAEMLDELADHVTEFSLAALNNLSRAKLAN